MKYDYFEALHIEVYLHTSNLNSAGWSQGRNLIHRPSLSKLVADNYIYVFPTKRSEIGFKVQRAKSLMGHKV